MLEVLFEYFAPFTIGKYNSEFRNTENMVLWSNETILYVYNICFLGYVYVHQKSLFVSFYHLNSFLNKSFPLSKIKKL